MQHETHNVRMTTRWAAGRAVAAGVCAVLVALTPAQAAASWGVALSGGSAATAQAGHVGLTVNSTCTATALATGCGSSNLLAANGATSTATITDSGTVANSYALTATSCGAATLADTAGTQTVAHGSFNASSYQTSGPLSGKALSFDGSTNWLGTGGTAATGLQTFTELAWFKTSTSMAGLIMTFQQAQVGGTRHDRSLWVYSGNLYAGVAPSSNLQEVTGSTAVSDGAWHLAAVTDSPTNGIKLYVDGTLIGSNATGAGAQSYTGWWAVGAGKLSGWSNEPTNANANGYSFFTGSLAGVAVLPSELSAANISTLHSESSLANYTTAVAGYSPTHYWGLQDAAPTPATATTATLPGQTAAYPDLSGTADDATATGGVSTAGSGPLSAGASATFDGSTGYLTTASSESAPTTFTELAWFKTTASGYQPILWFGDNASPLSTSASDRLLGLTNGAAGEYVWNGSAHLVTTPSSYNDGAWHLAAATLSSAGIKVYVDGVLKASDATTATAETYSGSTWWSVGAGNPSGSAAYFNGSLAGVAILPAALSSSQIAALHSAGSFSAYSGAVINDTPSEYWSLTTQSNACSAAAIIVGITVGGVTTCLLPAEATGTACPAVSTGGVPVTDVTTAVPNTAVSASTGASATLTITIADNGTLPAALSASGTGNTNSGVDLIIDTTITGGEGNWLVGGVYASSQTTL